MADTPNEEAQPSASDTGAAPVATPAAKKKTAKKKTASKKIASKKIVAKKGTAKEKDHQEESGNSRECNTAPGSRAQHPGASVG